MSAINANAAQENVKSPICDDPERAKLFDESQKRKLAAIGLIVAN